MAEPGYEIGWWIESEDEEVYGPVSRATLRKFLQEEVISRSTLVRHCTEQSARPVADVPGMLDGLELPRSAPLTGDRLSQVWPSSRRERGELAETEIRCLKHRKRPAIFVCLRCHAPYCRKCQAKPYRKHFYFCRRCQASHSNRRALALMVDSLLAGGASIVVSITLAAAGAAVAADATSETLFLGTDVLTWAAVLSNLMGLGISILFIFRDPLMAGAGPGKRLFGLIAVRTKDGTPLGYGQAFIRWLPFVIPFVILVEAVLSYHDPLQRRWGDRLAGTRVVDSEARLMRIRYKTKKKLAARGLEPMFETGVSAQQFALYEE